MLMVGFEPTISADERQKTYALRIIFNDLNYRLVQLFTHLLSQRLRKKSSLIFTVQNEDPFSPDKQITDTFSL